MKHKTLTDDAEEKAALYALGALSQFEARAYEVHLDEGCQACLEELVRSQQTVDALSLGSDPVAPPGYLRDLLAARIAKEASDPSISGRDLDANSEATGAYETKRRGFSGFLPWVVAAGLLIASAFAFLQWQNDRRSLQNLIAQQRRDAAAFERLNERLSSESERIERLRQINDVLSTPGSRIIELMGQESAPSSPARIYWNVRDHRWILEGQLPPAPSGKVYQLWFVTPAAKISAGLIRPDESGHGFAVISLPPDLGRLAAAAVTLEPEGGSDQPTSSIYLLGSI